MKSNPLIVFLREDEDRIAPNEHLRTEIAHQFTRAMPSRLRFWRSASLIGATAMVAMAFIALHEFQNSDASSFIAQANAAYTNLHTKLSEPGAVRHMIIVFSSEADPETNAPAYDGDPQEHWTDANGTSVLSGPLGAPNSLRIDEQNYLTQELYNEYFPEDLETGSGGVIGSNDDGSWTASTTAGDEGGRYSVTTPPDTASWFEKHDPEDPSIACVTINPLSDAQKAARDSMNAINGASDSISTGTGGPETLVTILEHSSVVEDRGIQHDADVGDIHVYRITYDSVLSGIDESEVGKRGFQEFGFSPETYLMRITRSGRINAQGGEFIESTMKILADEVLSEEAIGEDFFSPTRLGLVLAPPSELDRPETWPSFILHNGCYRAGKTEPEWLDAAEEAAARARIDALGDHAGMTGGGGF